MNSISPKGLDEAQIRAQLARIGLRWANCISWNAGAAELFQQAVERGEAEVTAAGALAVSTGSHTGRSPKDKFIVRNAAAEGSVWWEANAGLSQTEFDLIKADMMGHARLKSLFVQDLVAGADPAHAMTVRVITEHAWQALFIRHLLSAAGGKDLAQPDLTILCLPSFKADPKRHGTRSETVIALDLEHGLVLIGGTQYAGEIKKSVFTVMNHRLPARGVLPMHCSANEGRDGDTALFFGLSGTGKTTLSTDPARALIGDDEHGWSDNGIFNIEGGCYAKAINLTAESEPEIFAAANRFASVLENVSLDGSRAPDFADGSITENTRAAYPLEAISNAKRDARGAVPSAIIMLTADAFGVLPPVARLSPDEAMYHFMSGYTAKLAGTERGVKEPQATFSACFGAPFLTRHPSVYGEMLRQLIARHKIPCYLVNTGWTGGAYGVGKRFPLAVTRKLVTAALSGAIDAAPMRSDPTFGFAVPVRLPGVPDEMLDPRRGWSDAAAYDAAATHLKALFAENFEKFAEPARKIAAE
ncbi:MAG: phosphoenolpyruvate carboxykinase [Proteobacteria bacterium]|nr:phosphoenolpyruvate carboxykinase [Pseudomonadota bacterium]